MELPARVEDQHPHPTAGIRAGAQVGCAGLQQRIGRLYGRGRGDERGGLPDGGGEHTVHDAQPSLRRPKGLLHGRRPQPPLQNRRGPRRRPRCDRLHEGGTGRHARQGSHRLWALRRVERGHGHSTRVRQRTGTKHHAARRHDIRSSSSDTEEATASRHLLAPNQHA